MAFTPKSITKEHVLAAINRIEKEGLALIPSTKWDVEINGKLYPPKEVMRYAHFEMNGEHLWKYGGGEETNSYLEKFGFKISKANVIDARSHHFDIFVYDLKQALQEDDKTKDKFVFKKNAKEYVWIGDNKNIIGSKDAHYELSIHKLKDKYTVDLHFENTELNQKNIFKSVIDNLKPPLKSIRWLNSKSIRFGDGVDTFNFKSAIIEVKKQLEYLENNVGDAVRNILKSNTNSEMNIIEHPLNQILFGPPGTGKTYNTVNKALDIIGEPTLGKTRDEIKNIFDSKIKEGQIVFTTFHQSMSYEDFIEGIKPLKPLADDSFVKYDVQPGIFYSICDKAKSNYENSKDNNRKKLSFEDAFEQFKDAWENDNKMKFPLKTEGYDFIIIGFTNTSIQFEKASGGTGHTLSIGTLKELYYGKEYNFKHGVGIYYPAVLAKIQSFNKENSNEVLLKNYVLIIDEINRGNVSQIFGELITLIEDDKRLGKAEALEATLPYSKERFGVPPNLYIIGTMNTADRSVEALDAALRRRFSFEEMAPKPELLSPSNLLKNLWLKYSELDWEDKKWIDIENKFMSFHGGKFIDRNGYEDLEADANDQYDDVNFDSVIEFTGMNLEMLLNTINRRIEKLIDKDHQIGHSYFINISTIEELKLAFKNKIIPLLQEYFFGDQGKIGLIIGPAFFESLEDLEENIFVDFAEYDVSGFSERKIYKMINILEMTNDDFNKAINILLKK